MIYQHALLCGVSAAAITAHLDTTPVEPNDALLASEYTTIEGYNPGVVSKTNDVDGRLVLSMSNPVGGGKVLFQPSANIDPSGGVWDGTSDIELTFTIADHTGWDGTGAWLGTGLAIIDTNNDIHTAQLQSRNSTTGEYGHTLVKGGGFASNSTSGYTSENNPWGVDAISPKTVPIHIRVTLTASPRQLSIYRRPTTADAWILVYSSQNDMSGLSSGDKYGLVLFSLTGAQAFEIEISDITWNAVS